MKYNTSSKRLILPSQFKVFLRPRLKKKHKGSFGHVFIIGGSLQKIGAPLMSALSALKVGAGLSTCILPLGAFEKIDTAKLEVMYGPVGKKTDIFFKPSHLNNILKNITVSDVVAIGPGLGDKPDTIRLVQKLIPRIQQPLIIDADGLNIVAKNPEILKKRRGFTLLTPHPAEMGRLAGVSTKTVQANRTQIAKDFSQKYGVTLLLKGYHSVVAFSDGTVWINPTGNPAMANAVQGDVLTGIYAGLLAQFPKHTKGCAMFGCFLHGLVGDILAKQKRVVLATDIANHLGLGYQFLNRL